MTHELDASEELGRCVTSGHDYRQIKNSMHMGEAAIPYTVYANWDEEGALSVIRLDHPTLTEAIENGEATAKARGPKRQFHGWAVTRVGDVRRLNFHVKATPRPENKWHADIVMPDQDRLRQERHTELALELARASKWRPRPKKEDPVP